MKTIKLFVMCFLIINIITLSGCIEESFYYSDPGTINLVYDKYNVMIDLQNEISDLNNEAILSYNINEYSRSISLLNKAKQHNNQFNQEIEYFKVFIEKEYKNNNINKEEADYYYKQCFEHEGYSDENYRYITYMQKASEYSQKGDIYEANKYLDLAMSCLSKMNEHVYKVNLNAEYYNKQQ